MELGNRSQIAHLAEAARHIVGLIKSRSMLTQLS